MGSPSSWALEPPAPGVLSRRGPRGRMGRAPPLLSSALQPSTGWGLVPGGPAGSQVCALTTLGHAVACRPQHRGRGGSGGSAKWGGLGSAPSPATSTQLSPPPARDRMSLPPPICGGVHPVPERPSWPMGLGRRRASWALAVSSHPPHSSSTTCSHAAPRAPDRASASGGGPRVPLRAHGRGALGWWRLLGAQGWGRHVWGQVPGPRLPLSHAHLSVPAYLLPSCFPCCPWVLSNPTGTFVFLENKACQANAARFDFRLGGKLARGCRGPGAPTCHPSGCLLHSPPTSSLVPGRGCTGLTGLSLQVRLPSSAPTQDPRAPPGAREVQWAVPSHPQAPLADDPDGTACEGAAEKAAWGQHPTSTDTPE